MAITNPSLGSLEKLPAEIRNDIYDLVINSDDDLEVDYRRPCRQHQSLHLVSKQIHTETKGLYELAHQTTIPCKHTNFRVILPMDAAVDNFEWLTRNRHDHLDGMPHALTRRSHSVAENVETIRFITGHLAKKAPRFVVCHMRMPTGSAYEIHGGSAECREDMSQMLERILRNVEILSKDCLLFAAPPCPGVPYKTPRFGDGDLSYLAYQVRLVASRYKEYTAVNEGW